MSRLRPPRGCSSVADSVALKAQVYLPKSSVRTVKTCIKADRRFDLESEAEPSQPTRAPDSELGGRVPPEGPVSRRGALIINTLVCKSVKKSEVSVRELLQRPRLHSHMPPATHSHPHRTMAPAGALWFNWSDWCFLTDLLPV